MGAQMQGMGPRLQDAMPDPTRAVDASTDVEALAIHPQGRMASDASAEPREGGSTHPRVREPRPAFTGRGLDRLILGVLQVQETVSTV
jgi:hypothetical protein